MKPLCRAYVYKLGPNRSQLAKLEETLETCRRLYNYALAERCDATPARGASGSSTSVGFWASLRAHAQNPTEEDVRVEAENLTASEATDPRGKLLAIERELNAEIFERGEVIRSLLLALVAGEHVLLLGPPGTAKSQLSRSICERIDAAAYFSAVLYRGSMPDEIFGPNKLSALREDRFERNTEVMLPKAQIAFIDEIFKCLAGHTLVTLPDGTRRRMDSFSDGLPSLHAFDGTSLVVDKALRFVESPAQPIYKVT
jgi:hypothetical protein